MTQQQQNQDKTENGQKLEPVLKGEGTMGDATDRRLHAQPDAVDLFVALTTGEYVRQLADSPGIEEHEATWCVAARDAIDSLVGKLLDARDDCDRAASNYAGLFAATNTLLLGAKDIEERAARLHSEFTLSGGIQE